MRVSKRKTRTYSEKQKCFWFTHSFHHFQCELISTYWKEAIWAHATIFSVTILSLTIIGPHNKIFSVLFHLLRLHSTLLCCMYLHFNGWKNILDMRESHPIISICCVIIKQWLEIIRYTINMIQYTKTKFKVKPQRNRDRMCTHCTWRILINASMSFVVCYIIIVIASISIALPQYYQLLVDRFAKLFLIGNNIGTFTLCNSSTMNKI